LFGAGRQEQAIPTPTQDPFLAPHRGSKQTCFAYDDAILFNQPWHEHFAKLPTGSIW